MNRQEAIKQELCNLKDGQSFKASMTIKEARMAIASLNLDDREFSLHQDGQQICVTCHYTKKSKSEEVKAMCFIATAALGALFVFAILQTAFYEQDKAAETKIEVVK